MRTLKRNKVPVWYYLYNGKTEDYDSELGVYTGEWSETYSEPQKLMANVNPASGQASIEPFGIATDYTHIMAVESDHGIKEDTIVFVGEDPTNATEGFYRVTRVAKSLNHVRIALRELEISEVPVEVLNNGEEDQNRP